MEGVTIIGTTEKQSQISSAQPQSGRFLMPFDVDLQEERLRDRAATSRRGSSAASIPLNKTLKIGRTEFRVIGVMEKQGGSFLGGPNFDRQVFIPITSYVRAFGGRPRARGREHRGQGADARRRWPTSSTR